MKDVEIEVNTEQIIKLFDNLKPNKQKTVFRATMRKAASLLVNQARKNLRKVVINSKSRNYWNNETMEQGIKSNVWKSGEGAKVNIMKDFRLKFFELGTVERFTRHSNKSTGRIKPNWFFRNAKQQTETKIFNEIDENIGKNIMKIWTKQNKNIMKDIFQSA